MLSLDPRFACRTSSSHAPHQERRLPLGTRCPYSKQFPEPGSKARNLETWRSHHDSAENGSVTCSI